MDSKIVQFLPLDFVADCRFLMDNGRHNFETLALTARTLVEHVKGKKEALISGEEPGPRARILAFPGTPEETRQHGTKEKLLSIPMLEALGFEVWGYRVFKVPAGTTALAMMRKGDGFFSYDFTEWGPPGRKNEIRVIPGKYLKHAYKLYGPRTGRIVPPEVALPILTSVSGCTALESEPGGT